MIETLLPCLLLRQPFVPTGPEKNEYDMTQPDHTRRLGIRAKLILVFILIKVLPLLLLAWYAWYSAQRLGHDVAREATRMADSMFETVRVVGDTVTQDAIEALDARSREAIEALTTEAARQVASFLYERDDDIRYVASLAPDADAYNRFIQRSKRDYYDHVEYVLAEDGSGWVPVDEPVPEARITRRISQYNSHNFNSRAPEYLGVRTRKPLYHEITFVDLDGFERIKVTATDLTTPELRHIADRRQTFVNAESYWQDLRLLRPGEIYVSNVIGAYVPSLIVGPYTPAAAERAGIDFAPTESAYAGTENPVGRRFRGIVRWATPVVRDEQIIGYVTLALDHDHIRQFTDRLMPTEVRYTPIIDAIEGNYAFMWDHRGRSIAHPRDFFIVGYDAETGYPVPPWMDETLYDEWQASGLPAHVFLESIEPFRDQSLDNKPALAQRQSGISPLDCRYLNFSPQCEGWQALTEHGGSGSFLIYFSGLWKLVTAAAIPYYTGQYGDSLQGFGFVTIGANVDDFHRAATESGQRISALIEQRSNEFALQRSEMLDGINRDLAVTAWGLTASTVAMTVIVIFIAIMMANMLTTRITGMIKGIRRFESGDLEYRLDAKGNDEMGDLAQSLNVMADSVAESFKRLDEARHDAEQANRAKSEFLSTVSHELRTPLNGILGFAELLEAEASNPEQAEYANTIHESGKHLLALVNDLLDLSKIEAGRMELNMTDVALTPIIEELCSLHRGVAARKGLDFIVEISPDLPETLHTDSTRLRQILNNLLNNAVKFTDSGHVGLHVLHTEDGLTFSVVDTGCGIPEALQPLVFEKFRQAESFSTRSHGGTGLGLTLARQFAHMMQGTLSVESVHGKGSLFVLRLPAGGDNTHA